MSDVQKKIALEIVEDLERQFSELTWASCSWDSDAAAETIALLIPLTAAEQEDEFQRMIADIADEDCGPPRPSKFAALREAVHATDGMSITCVIEAATQEIKRLRVALQDILATVNEPCAVNNNSQQWAMRRINETLYITRNALKLAAGGGAAAGREPPPAQTVRAHQRHTRRIMPWNRRTKRERLQLRTPDVRRIHRVVGCEGGHSRAGTG